MRFECFIETLRKLVIIPPFLFRLFGNFRLIFHNFRLLLLLLLLNININVVVFLIFDGGVFLNLISILDSQLLIGLLDSQLLLVSGFRFKIRWDSSPSNWQTIRLPGLSKLEVAKKKGMRFCTSWDHFQEDYDKMRINLETEFGGNQGLNEGTSGHKQRHPHAYYCHVDPINTFTPDLSSQNSYYKEAIEYTFYMPNQNTEGWVNFNYLNYGFPKLWKVFRIMMMRSAAISD